ncbi:MAG TPA: amino acid ABC transporter permease [Actinomycetota bacterium]|nr:amino acid ABC transporter permease [Actinomycetota bacterium]
MDLFYLFDPDNWEWLFAGKNAEFILRGFLINIQIALICMVLSMIFGLLLALGRISKKPWLKGPVGIWIDVWRNLPLIFILLFLFLWMPEWVKTGYEDNAPGFLPDALSTKFVVAAILGLTLYNSAVIAEIMRAGIQSLEKGQGEAAAALGLTYRKAMRLVILPQGLRRMVPATVSQLITLNKDTTLVYVINIQEVVRHTRTVVATSDSPFVGLGVPAPYLQTFVFVGLLFIITNFALSRLSRRLEIKQRQRTGVVAETVTGLEDQVALDAETRPAR